jgi:hypothetical protein
MKCKRKSDEQKKTEDGFPGTPAADNTPSGNQPKPLENNCPGLFRAGMRFAYSLWQQPVKPVCVR